jgi:hypothetical protein
MAQDTQATAPAVDTQSAVQGQDAVVDDSYLQVTLSQEVYDAVKDIAERADGRGLNSSFDYWLSTLITKHAKVVHNTWDQNDITSMAKLALAGNNQARRAMGKSLGLQDSQIDAFIAMLPKKK